MSSLVDMNSVIGIIYPPSEVRHIIDRTATFVAKNGLDFESNLRQREIANPRFNFMNNNDPYNGYYKYKIREFLGSSGAEETKNFTKNSNSSEPIRFTVSELLPPKNPPPEPEFIAEPTTFQALDIDIIRLTALFVAANGRRFLANLMNNEQSNYQFDFLRPQHSNFLYFTKLLDQYSKILLPTKTTINEMNEELSNPKIVMDKVKLRTEWYRYQDREKKRKEEIAEKERLSYSQIDWHDFVIVDTIDFRPNEKGDLPPPTTPEEVGARILQQERIDKQSSASNPFYHNQFVRPKSSSIKPKPPHPVIEEKREDEVSMMDVSKIPLHLTMEEAAPPIWADDKSKTDNLIICKNYDPKEHKKENVDSAYLVSPLTKEKIPPSTIPQHMRIGLLGSNWKEQREKKLEEQKEDGEVYATGEDIDNTLKSIAERRSDIFGDGDVETTIGKKIGEEFSTYTESPQLTKEGVDSSDANGSKENERIGPVHLPHAKKQRRE